jgi:DNA-binding XRE family transcriptional regulator
VNTPKYAEVAAMVRAQVADGTLIPGMLAPSGAALARTTGCSTLTCRRALRTLIADGVLVQGASRNARPRVPGLGNQALADARRALSGALATRRRATGLTQPQLAGLIGVSVTHVGHAETGRLWQSRPFWEHADNHLSADGELLRLYDVYRAAEASVEQPVDAEVSVRESDLAERPAAVTIDMSGPVASISITWLSGAVTTVYPPAGHVPPTTECGAPEE